MAAVMNEEDKKRMLDEILADGESYQVKIWGTIMADAKTLALIGAIVGGVGGAFTNAYCYVGLTEKHLNFAVVDSIKVDVLRNQISIPLESVKGVKVKKGLFGRTVVNMDLGDSKMKLSLVNNTIGSKLVGQKEGVEKLTEVLSRY